MKRITIFWIALVVVNLLQHLPSVAIGEELVIIVNKANPVSALSAGDITKIYKADKQFWDNGEKILLLMREPGSPEREIALKQIYKMTDGNLKKFWLQKTFTGQAASLPKDVPSSTLMKKTVSNAPSAIGYIHKGEVDDTVKVLEVDGME